MIYYLFFYSAWNIALDESFKKQLIILEDSYINRGPSTLTNLMKGNKKKHLELFNKTSGFQPLYKYLYEINSDRSFVASLIKVSARDRYSRLLMHP